MRGFFGIAMYYPKYEDNWGSLIRTANILGANFVACIGPRFQPQCSDTMKSHRHLPVFEYSTFEEFYEHLPYDCKLIGIELAENAVELGKFKHPHRAIYLLGAEDFGLPEKVLTKCHDLVKLKGERSMNVSIAGSIVLYHREGVA
ncbi:MAG: RNA methyltransferase [Flavobacteriaceae bacterium]|nr:RNA methyltransferase [Flavobacteriaceae bacterium]